MTGDSGDGHLVGQRRRAEEGDEEAADDRGEQIQQRLSSALLQAMVSDDDEATDVCGCGNSRLRTKEGGRGRTTAPPSPCVTKFGHDLVGLDGDSEVASAGGVVLAGKGVGKYSLDLDGECNIPILGLFEILKIKGTSELS